LLRFKVRQGDQVPEIMGECFESLLTLAFVDSLPLVASFLHAGNEQVRQAAVFALAESRRPEASNLLKEYWPHAAPALQEAVLLAIAMFRLPAAVDFLIDIVAQKHPQSRAAVSALAIQRHDAKITQRVAAAVAGHSEPMRQWFAKKFGQDG